MRILIHTDEYYPTAQACAYRMQVFTDTFIEQGNQVTVITSSANKQNGKRTGLRRERIIYSPTVRMKKKTTLYRLLNNLSFAFTSIISALGVGKVDVVITTSPPLLVNISGWIIAKCKRAKLVFDVRDIWPDVALEMGSFSKDSFFSKSFSLIAKFMYEHSDIITTVSPGKVEKIKMHLNERNKKGVNNAVQNDKVWLVGNGFDENIVNCKFDQAIIDSYGLDDRPTCIYIGNIGLAQGLGSLLDVALKTTHKEVQFLIFGMGAEKELLEQRIKDEKIENVTICGPVDHSKVFSLLSRAKISYIPLKNSNMRDSVPTKIYEALGIGCPVLLVAEGDSRNIVEQSRLGRCVSPEQIEKLAATFDDMLENYKEIIGHKNEAVKLMFEQYSRQKIAKQFEQDLHILCK